ncbi:MAG: hypothetical protein OHK0052_03920 [Anaerolineales bacterium]
MPEKILVVDDDVDTLRLVGLMLQRQGYAIVAASNGRQALTMAAAEMPDLIILDVMMPDMDGYEVTKQLRANPQTAGIPIIMFTAKSQIDDKVSGFESGADDYLTKPTQPRELFAHVKALLARSSKTRASAPAEPARPAVERGYTIGVLAAKGGLGVTTLTLNLALALRAKSRKGVVVGEYRPGMGTMGLELGFVRPDGLRKVLEMNPSELTTREIEQHLLTHSSNVQFLLASYETQECKYILNAERFESLTRSLAYMGRYILLDLGTSITPINEKVLPLCNEVIIVVEPAPNTVKQTRELLQSLASMGFGQGRLRIVLINRTRSDVQMSWTQVQEELGQNLAVIITPAPEALYQAALRSTPLMLLQPEGLTAQQIGKLTAAIVSSQPATQ